MRNSPPGCSILVITEYFTARETSSHFSSTGFISVGHPQGPAAGYAVDALAPHLDNAENPQEVESFLRADRITGESAEEHGMR